MENKEKGLEYNPQKNVINRINYDSGQNNPHLINQDDECYTGMQEIVNELCHWKNKFSGKNIICPCDWDIINENGGSNVYSIRIEFDEDTIHGHTNTVKSVTYSLFDFDEDTNNIARSVKLSADEIDVFLREQVRCNFLRTFIQYGKEWNIKSITASGYNPATGLGYDFENVDFSDYDICVTNPPFSLFPRFMDKLIESKIDFIILAPFLNRSSPSVGLHLMKREAYLGYGRQLHINFINPTEGNAYHTKKVCVDWITSFDDAQKEIDQTERLRTGISYEDYKDHYKFMENITMKDGTHPLQIKNVSVIPEDYDGWMLCSVGILDKLSNEEFEWYMTNAAGYYNSNRDLSPFTHRAYDEMIMASSYIENFADYPQKQRRKMCKEIGEKGFHGILIKRRKK